MSKIYISDIVGMGSLAVPSTDAALATAGDRMNGRLVDAPSLVNLTYTSLRAFVRDSKNADGSEGERTLNCILDGFLYNLDHCPSEADTDQLLDDIVVALKAVVGEVDGWITDVGVIRVNAWGVPPV